jgi:hypothetical protein
MFASMLAKPAVLLGLVVVGLLALAVISRNWSCKPVKPPRPPHSDTFGVVEVPTGASIIVQYGLMGKKRATVALAHIQAPLTGPEAEASVEALSLAAGDVVRIEWQRGGLLRSEAPDATDDATGPPEARPPAVGVVFGESGQDLALAQLAGGFATCLTTAPDAYKKAEKSAKRRK